MTQLLDVKCYRLRKGHTVYSVEHDCILTVQDTNHVDETFTLSNDTMYSYSNDYTTEVLASSLGIYLLPSIPVPSIPVY